MRVTWALMGLMVLCGCDKDSVEPRGNEVFASALIGTQLVEFETGPGSEAVFTPRTQIGFIEDSAVVYYDVSLWERRTSERLTFRFTFKYDPALLVAEEREWSFEDLDTFYESFQLGEMTYFDMDDQRYPSFAFYYVNEEGTQFQTHRDRLHDYQAPQNDANFLIEDIKAYEHPDLGPGILMRGVFNCNLFEQESGLIDELNDGEFQVFLEAP